MRKVIKYVRSRYFGDIIKRRIFVLNLDDLDDRPGIESLIYRACAGAIHGIVSNIQFTDNEFVYTEYSVGIDMDKCATRDVLAEVLKYELKG